MHQQAIQSLVMKRTILGLTLCAVLSWAKTGYADVVALDTPIEGPSRLCFMYSRFQLAAHERVTSLSMGIHAMSLEVNGPHGQYSVSESDNFATPRTLGPAVFETETLAIYRVGQGGEIQYAVVGFADFAPNEARVLVWLSGPALNRSFREKVFRRISIGEPVRAKCDRGFRYGWNFED